MLGQTRLTASRDRPMDRAMLRIDYPKVRLDDFTRLRRQPTRQFPG